MKRLLLAILLLLPISASAQFNGCSAGFCAPAQGASAHAMVTPIMNSAGGVQPSATAVNYVGLNGGGWGSFNSRDVPMAIPGTVSGLTAYFPTTIATGQYTLTLFKNNAATALQCVITTGNTCSNNSSVSYVAGDLLAWQSCPGTVSGSTCTAGTPTAQAAPVYISVIITSTNNGESLVAMPSNGGSPSSTVANYNFFGAAQTWNATEATASTIVPTAGNFAPLYVKADSAPGTGKQVVYTVYKNGSATGLACIMANSATTCNSISAGTNATVSGVATDLISLQSCPGTQSGVAGSCTPTGTPGTDTTRASMRWVPTTPGESIVMNNNIGGMSTSSVKFFPVADSAQGNTEANTESYVPNALTLKKFYCAVDVAPGVAKSWTSILRAGTAGGTQSNAGTPSTVTCTISGASSTSNNDTTNSFAASLNAVVNIQETPAGTPAANAFYKTSWVAFIP